MTDQERTQSILSELEYGYIGYGNMHEDDDHGLKVIEKALKKTEPMEPETLYENGCLNAFCPKCKSGLGLATTSKTGVRFCRFCDQRLLWPSELINKHWERLNSEIRGAIDET